MGTRGGTTYARRFQSHDGRRALALPAHAADIPQYVKGPISGLIYDCEKSKQTPPQEEAYVSRADFDGDGKPDYVVDTGKGCAANRALFCSAEGCTLDVYLSLQEGLGGKFKAVDFAIGKTGKGDALVLDPTKGTGACTLPKPPDAEGPCGLYHSFDGEQLVPWKP